jgi:hypothetical protein
MSEAEKIELLSRLKNQLVNFLDELIETFPDESDFIIWRLFIKNQARISEIMDFLIKELCPLYNQVKMRDESFFLEHDIVLAETKKNPDTVNHFKRIWTQGNLDKNDKEVIWQWFDSIISIGRKYTEICRKK